MPKLVYIAHPVAGNVDENIRDVLRICKEVHTKETIPMAPYLVAVQYLNDHLNEERELGIVANIEHFKRKVMDETWVCGPRISEGMKEEIRLSTEYGIPIKCYNPKLKSELDKLLQGMRKKSASLP
mgnify:FL=1